MVHSIEFYGRLVSYEPRTPGVCDLLFRLYPAADSGPEEALWEERHGGITVEPGGFFRLVLGQHHPLSGALFDGSPRWVSVTATHGGRTWEEARFSLLGNELLLDGRLSRIEQQLSVLDSPVRRKLKARKRLLSLVRRLRALEHGGGALNNLNTRLGQIETSLRSVAGDDGRLDRIEDELEDIVGPDGDVVDLTERMDRLESRLVELGLAPARTGLRDPGASARSKMEELERRVQLVEQRVANVPEEAISAESLGVVKRAGDTMNGALTISKGGLNVVSGGIKCRGAEVNSLDASVQVRTPKLVTDALELRGDLTVDNTLRTIQVRHIEGRAGSGRKDGTLHLNSRSGAEVVVGRSDEESGLLVHGPTRASRLEAPLSAVAEVFMAGEPLESGDVVCMQEDGLGLVRTTAGCDTRVVGVVVNEAGLTLGPAGDGRVRVALYGTVQCKASAAEAPIRVGDLLVSSEIPGHARAVGNLDQPFGAVIGKALAPLEVGRGAIPVLVMLR